MSTRSHFTLSLLAALAFQAMPALAADLSPLPPTQMQNGISYVTGGIGSPESTAMKAAAGRYDLALTFANRSSEFYSDVKVDISDNRGNRVLDIVSGPMLLVNLPDGPYKVRAEVGGVPRVQTINVRGSHHRQVAYVWPDNIDQRPDFAAFEPVPTEPKLIILPPMKSETKSDEWQYGGGLDHVSDGIWSDGFKP